MAQLEVATVNEPALRLYEPLGFRTYAAEPMRLPVNGLHYREYLMG